MYGTGTDFWLDLLFILATILIVLFAFNVGMRKLLKVERRKVFSYNHVNEKHSKIDWTIRISVIALLFIGFFVNVSRLPMDPFWFLEP